MLAAGAGLAVALGAGLLWLGPTSVDGLLRNGGPSPAFAIQFAIFAVSGLSVLALAARELSERRDPDALLLALWVGGTFVFAGWVNWTINARSILPMLPAAALLVARALDAKPAGSRRWPLWLAPAAVVAMLAAWSDHSLAAAGRQAAVRIATEHAAGSHAIWFQGHWGFQYYLERSGGRAMDFDDVVFARGDIVVIPRNNVNNPGLPGDRAQFVETLPFPVSGWATTLQGETEGGFYSDRLGSLPFVLGPIPDERYDVYRMTAAVRGKMELRLARF